MLDQDLNSRLANFLVSGVGTTAGNTVTMTGVANEKFVVTHASGSSDAAGIVTIESPSGTVLWRKRFAAAYTFSEDFQTDCVRGTSGGSVLLKLSASTTNCETNLAGYSISG